MGKLLKNQFRQDSGVVWPLLEQYHNSPEGARDRMLGRMGITARNDSTPEEARRRMLERMGIQGREGGAAAARERFSAAKAKRSL